VLDQVKLTATVKAAGCAAKLSPSVLDSVLRRLPRQVDDNVVVGFETSDDAGVYRLSSGLALVQTVDFFTPIVDDPFSFGQIAAANALSDVYAMGGRPISALSIVAFPEKGAVEILEQILRGGLAKMDEAGCTVIGGHSIRDDDMKFGYAVTGLIDPGRVWRNVGAQPGHHQVDRRAEAHEGAEQDSSGVYPRSQTFDSVSRQDPQPDGGEHLESDSGNARKVLPDVHFELTTASGF